MVARVRLNLVLAPEIDDQLTNYCAYVGRTPTEVMRQLLIEWVEGDRHITAPTLAHPTGRRTNVMLTAHARSSLEERLSTEGHATISAVLHALLAAFLAARAPTDRDTMTLRLKLPIRMYDRLSAAAKLHNADVQQMTITILKAHLDTMVSALQERAM